jgi:hypothetical protein
MIASETKKQIKRKLTLEWYASLVEYCPPYGLLSLVHHGFGVFSSEQGEEDVK